eukprot:365449-Chlamydomonas_euryale.AAC.1
MAAAARRHIEAVRRRRRAGARPGGAHTHAQQPAGGGGRARCSCDALQHLLPVVDCQRAASRHQHRGAHGHAAHVRTRVGGEGGSREEGGVHGHAAHVRTRVGGGGRNERRGACACCSRKYVRWRHREEGGRRGEEGAREGNHRVRPQASGWQTELWRGRCREHARGSH